MFGRVFAGEFKKLIRPKGLIVIGVLFVIFFIIFAVFYNLNIEAMIGSLDDFLVENGEESIFGDATYYDEDGNPISEREYGEQYGYADLDYFKLADADNINNIISDVEARINMLKSIDAKRNANALSLYKGDLAMLKYMRDNNLYGDLNIEGRTSFGMKNAESFVMTYFTVVLAILVIYGIVLGAGLYADEYKRGTIKLVMLRPISRAGLTGAKLLATFAYLAGISAIMSLISFFYGLISFGSVATKTVYVVFNQSSVIKSTAGGVVFYQMFFKTLEMFAIVTLAFMIGTVTRKKTLSIVISLVIELGLIAAILNMIGLQRFIFSTNLDLSDYFGISTNIPAGGNFFIALTMFVVYTAAIVSALFITVQKRDVI